MVQKKSLLPHSSHAQTTQALVHVKGSWLGYCVSLSPRTEALKDQPLPCSPPALPDDVR